METRYCHLWGIITIVRWLRYHVMALSLDIPFGPSCQCLLSGDSVLTALLKGPQGAVLLQCTFSANSLQVILSKGKIIAYIASLTRI